MKKLNKSPFTAAAQKGFTLIELVVVIVILGILAATAAPKFIDLTGDAKASTIKALRGSIESATTMIHAKALVAGETTGTPLISVNGGTNNVRLANGWPSNVALTWAAILEINADDFLTRLTGSYVTAGANMLWYPAQEGVLSEASVLLTKCYVKYVQSTSSNTRPVITVVTDGC